MPWSRVQVPPRPPFQESVYMAFTAYYIYALKDPRQSPAKPFYIGKGTGIRATEHMLKVDNTRKGKRINEIHNAHREVIVSILADNLTEIQALKLEAELICAFGTEASGGMLTNSVVPTGVLKTNKQNVNVPDGLLEKAQLGLSFLKDAIHELAQANPMGVQNGEIVKALNLKSDYLGGSKDYLTWSILGILMRENRLKRIDKRRHIAIK